jgi:8-amino-3,8-dideoxy-alpha-D-manno-octulosonate transaminase
LAQSTGNNTLAINGGQKAVTGTEGRGEPKVGVEEFMSVAERFGFSQQTLERIRGAVSSDDLNGGPHLASYGNDRAKRAAYEKLARETFGIQHALGVSSGTGALHSAFVAAGVGPGTEVICPAIGFYATAATVIQARGIPVFCDVDASLGIDPGQIESLITPRTVAIAPTHVMGTVCDMAAVMEIARKHDLRVIEDCAQSCGGKFQGRHVGTWGDLGCFSISVYKIVGGSEGGLLITNDERLYERAHQLAECGGLWRPDRFAPPRYDGELFSGTNYRMSELEAAIDVVQLGRMPEVVARHHQVKMRILSQLKRYREIVPQKLNDPDGEIGYVLRFYPESTALGNRIAEALNAEGVGGSTRGDSDRPDWHLSRYMFPITLQSGATEEGCPFTCPIYADRGGKASYEPGDCPVAEDLFNRMITIGLNQWYTDADCDNVAAGINKVLSAYCTKDPSAREWV